MGRQNEQYAQIIFYYSVTDYNRGDGTPSQVSVYTPYQPRQADVTTSWAIDDPNIRAIPTRTYFLTLNGNRIQIGQPIQGADRGYTPVGQGTYMLAGALRLNGTSAGLVDFDQKEIYQSGALK